MAPSMRLMPYLTLSCPKSKGATPYSQLKQWSGGISLLQVGSAVDVVECDGYA